MGNLIFSLSVLNINASQLMLMLYAEISSLTCQTTIHPLPLYKGFAKNTQNHTVGDGSSVPGYSQSCCLSIEGAAVYFPYNFMCSLFICFGEMARSVAPRIWCHSTKSAVRRKTAGFLPERDLNSNGKQ